MCRRPSSVVRHRCRCRRHRRRRRLYLLSSHVSTVTLFLTLDSYHVNTVQVLFNDYYVLVFTLSRKYSTSTFNDYYAIYCA